MELKQKQKPRKVVEQKVDFESRKLKTESRQEFEKEKKTKKGS